MKKTRLMLLAVMFAALGLTACSGGTESTETTAAASSAEEVSTEESGGEDLRRPRQKGWKRNGFTLAPLPPKRGFHILPLCNGARWMPRRTTM